MEKILSSTRKAEIHGMEGRLIVRNSRKERFESI